MTAKEEHESIAYWQGTVDGELKAHRELIAALQGSMDRVESKVNSLKNQQFQWTGGLRVGALVGSFVSAIVLLIFGAYVGGVFT